MKSVIGWLIFINVIIMGMVIAFMFAFAFTNDEIFILGLLGIPFVAMGIHGFRKEVEYVWNHPRFW